MFTDSFVQRKYKSFEVGDMIDFHIVETIMQLKSGNKILLL
jgi:hypothetical protein